jgi:general secretion pathway protein D
MLTWTRSVALGVTLAMLAACARTPTFATGQHLLAAGKTEEGLKTLQQAVNENPRNQEVRSFFYRQRESAIARLLSQGDEARAAQDPEAAERSYRRVLSIDAGNTRAQAGLERLQAERRHRAMVAEAESLVRDRDAEGALRKIRALLAENPNSRDGRALLRLIEEQRVKTALATPALKPALAKLLSLEFREANLKSIFELISRSSGINFLFDKDVRADGRATLFVRNTTVEEVVKNLLITNQLEQKVVNENTVLIYPNTPAKAREYQELVIKSFYLTNTDAKQALNLIRTILHSRDVYIDEKLNVLVMRDTPEAVRLAEKLIANHDLAEPEVVLDVEVTEIKRSRLSELGIQYPNQFSVLNLANSSTVTTSGGTVVANTPAVTANPLTLDTLRNLNSARIGISPVLLNLRSEQSDANLLANPRIRVKNREKARIHIGDRVPVITSTALANVGVTESVSYLDVGLRLEVEPSVNLDDEVGIRVGLEVSSIVREIKSGSGTLTYQIGTRSASTNLRLRDGETQALAGLINDEDRKSANKLPGLGDLPILGRLFSSERKDATKTEIILLITPRIVRNLVRPDATSVEFASGTDASVGSAFSRPGITESTSPLANSAPSASAEPFQPSPRPATPSFGFGASPPATSAGPGMQPPMPAPSRPQPDSVR